MSQINYNRDAIAQSIALKISEATDITSFSQSSKLKLLVDIFSNEITNLAKSYDLAVQGLYAETAIENDLDIKGAQYGVYRKNRNSIYADKSDGIMMIRPKEEGDFFSDSIREPITINRGERLDVGSTFYIIVAEDIYIVPSDILVLVSGTVISEDGSGFTINKDDVFKMKSRYGDTSKLNSLLLEFLKPISIDGSQESDDDFRRRVILARDGDNIATTSAIMGEVSALPELSGYSIMENKRGSGSLDIGVTTRTLQETSEDENLFSTLGVLRTSILLVAPVGIDVLIYAPNIINLIIEYSTESNNISDENILSAIVESFRSIYTYNAINSISAMAIEDKVNALLPTVSIVITKMDLFDPSINAVISTSSNTVMAPLDYFIYLDKDSITREVVDG